MGYEAGNIHFLFLLLEQNADSAACLLLWRVVSHWQCGRPGSAILLHWDGHTHTKTEFLEGWNVLEVEDGRQKKSGLD